MASTAPCSAAGRLGGSRDCGSGPLPRLCRPSRGRAVPTTRAVLQRPGGRDGTGSSDASSSRVTGGGGVVPTRGAPGGRNSNSLLAQQLNALWLREAVDLAGSPTSSRDGGLDPQQQLADAAAARLMSATSTRAGEAPPAASGGPSAEAGTVLYFAYGANMSFETLARRGVRPVSRDAACVVDPGFRLVFKHRGGTWRPLHDRESLGTGG